MPGTTAERPDLAALRAAVYRPGATAEDVAALQRALDEIREPEPGPSAPEPPAVAAGADGRDVEGWTSAEPQRVAGADAAQRFRTRRWIAVGTVAATVAGCAAGATLVLLSRPASSTAAVVPTMVHISATADDALLRRTQRPIDRPSTPLDPSLVPSSLRRVLAAGRIALYVAQDRTGRRCLVGVQGGTVLSCVTPERFHRSGLRILWTSNVVAVDSAGLRELRYRLSLAADWRPDGRVILGAVSG